MGRNDKTSAPPAKVPKTAQDKPKKPASPTETEDDFEDGDFVSPKRDRDGNDDEPL
jgi:hypothetical protein